MSDVVQLTKTNRVSKVERDLNTHSITVTDNKNYSDEFVVKANNESDSDHEHEDKKEEEKKHKPVEKVDESDLKKFSKYNQIYDRIRKKRDELQALFMQR